MNQLVAAAISGRILRCSETAGRRAVDALRLPRYRAARSRALSAHAGALNIADAWQAPGANVTWAVIAFRRS